MTQNIFHCHYFNILYFAFFFYVILSILSNSKSNYYFVYKENCNENGNGNFPQNTRSGSRTLNPISIGFFCGEYLNIIFGFIFDEYLILEFIAIFCDEFCLKKKRIFVIWSIFGQKNQLDEILCLYIFIVSLSRF